MIEETDNPYINLVTKTSVIPHTRNRQEEIDKLQIKIQVMTTAWHEMISTLGVEYEKIRSTIIDIERM